MKFANVILPLTVSQTYTFGVPIEMQDQIKVGCRVEVQFGAKKIYSGIVKELHDRDPEAYTVKPILNIIDQEPIVTAAQLKFWEWIANYYNCTEGDVMSAALPAHLKLVSDTFLVLQEGVQMHEHELTDDEFLVMQALEIKQLEKEKLNDKS